MATLILAGGYAGWAGSLLPAEVERRLAFALDTADRLPEGFEPESMRGLFSDKLSPEAAAVLRTVMSEGRPVATRTMLMPSLRRICMTHSLQLTWQRCSSMATQTSGRRWTVADDLRRTIPRSSLVVLPGLGHECYLEDPDRFNAEVRGFLEA